MTKTSVLSVNSFSGDPAFDNYLLRLLQGRDESKSLIHVKRTPGQAEPGDIWQTTMRASLLDEPECPTYVLILEADHDMEIDGKEKRSAYRAASVFNEVRRAGMMDVVLSAEIMGYKVAVALGSAFPMLSTGLSACVGKLPDEAFRLVTGYLACLDRRSDTLPEGLVIGRPFIDDRDPSAIFHDQLIESTFPLQVQVEEFLR